MQAAGADPHPRQAGIGAGPRGGVEDLAKVYSRAQDFLFLGRGIHYPIALEGALKLKEISYIHAEGLSGGRDEARAERADRREPAGGDDCHQDRNEANSMLRYEKTLVNLKEVKARSGKVIAMATEGDDEIARGRPTTSSTCHRRRSCCRLFWRSCRCNCWPTTLPCAAAATSTSRGTWPSR